MYQQNKEVLYSRKQIIILLAPLVLITLFSIPFMYITSLNLLFKVNMILNIMGSSIDCGLVFKLLTEHNDDILINYDYSKEEGVILNANK